MGQGVSPGGRASVRVAAYQAPLLAAGSMESVHRMQAQVRRCERDGVALLCCPEAILGGLADYADDPLQFAVSVDRLAAVLEPLASDTVTAIVGFTELAPGRRLHNSAAVFHRGRVIGVYRKLHPAIRRSVYHAGAEVPVFTIGALTFGIVICNDSNYAEPARRMAAQGATALFVPTNNGLPPEKGGPGLVELSRAADVARAIENGVWVIRSDVAGRCNGMVSHGSSEIVNPRGIVVHAAAESGEDLLTVDIAIQPDTAAHT